MNTEYMYMLMLISWSIGGMFLFKNWIRSTELNSMLRLACMSVLCGPIVLVINSMLVLHFCADEL